MTRFQTPLRDTYIAAMLYLCDDTISEKNEEPQVTFFFSVCEW